jgi:uncharacterized protein involved in exopolysaccharide biosynthesis
LLLDSECKLPCNRKRYIVGDERTKVTQTATKAQPEAAPSPIAGGLPVPDFHEDGREWQAQRLRLLWRHRRSFLQAAGVGLAMATVIALLIPNSYTASTQLMPPDAQSTSGMAMMAAMASRAGGGLGAIAGDLLGLKTSGALFVGVLRSQTSQERLVEEFRLQSVYGKPLLTDARLKLDANTSIGEDRKSGIITISVNDRSPQRAAALAAAYVDELNSLVVELSTSAAHRERVFLDERLKLVKQDLDEASNQLAQFSSKNNTLDIQQEGRAMLEAAANLAGQMIAAQSQLEGLRQIYTDNNPRVQALSARVSELRKELGKLSGSKGVDTEDLDRPGNGASNLPYPSIRNLPLLGVKYADYYRHAKVQETVFELLTEQYEMAKVEEAKETPSVKVLDPARIPEKKSFPPRLTIMFLGTFLAFAVCAGYVLGSERWKEVDAEDPRKLFVQEIAGTWKFRSWATRNGNGSESLIQKLGVRLSSGKAKESSAATE